MRVSIVSILLAGGMLAMGACASLEPSNLTLAEQTARCPGIGSRAVPTGRETGNVRQDYRCESVHARANRGDNGVSDAGAQRSAAVDRSLRRGY